MRRRADLRYGIIMLSIKVDGAIRHDWTSLPRMVRESATVPAADRHCAECDSLPPTRWWQFEDLMLLLSRTDRGRELRDKHGPQSPVFLCDYCVRSEVRARACPGADLLSFDDLCQD